MKSNSTTYRIILSDKKKIEIESTSSGAACEEARWKYRGRSIVECYSGLKQPDIDILQAIDHTKKYMLGHIQHEIPEHDPIPESAVRPKLIQRRVDTTEALFAPGVGEGGRLAD